LPGRSTIRCSPYFTSERADFTPINRSSCTPRPSFSSMPLKISGSLLSSTWYSLIERSTWARRLSLLETQNRCVYKQAERVHGTSQTWLMESHHRIRMWGLQSRLQVDSRPVSHPSVHHSPSPSLTTSGYLALDWPHLDQRK